ncbi:MAG TPA: hypothetical protein VHB73_06620, partial [Alphaproteobacteria bacterium]|nr:hypothetical protein [Alphaproteobacteria bacterium]
MGLISITGIDYTAARNSLPAKLLAELLLEKGKDLVGSTECFTNLDINIFHQNLLDLGQTIIQEKKRLGVPGERCLATVEETLQVVFMHPKLDKARRTSRERALFQAMTYLEMAERACSGTNLQKVTPEQLRIVK